MNILIGCERSGIVRDAFIKRGHNAVSCDLVDSEREGPHIKGNVLDYLTGWDMGIFFPDCTFLCSSGLHWNKRRPERQQQTEAALEFVRQLLSAPIPRIALENPIGCISSRIRKPTQIIQPYEFGHDESKSTCLWLKGLPKLRPTNNVIRPAWVLCDNCEDYFCQRHGLHAYDCECPGIEDWVERNDDPYKSQYANQTPSGQNKLGPSEERAMLRARTYEGVAEAMAEQWG